MIPEEIKLPGEIVAAELVADRRGSQVWRVTLADWHVLAVKYATDNHEAQGVQGQARLLAARETSVLRHLDRDDYLIASGETSAGTWLALKWHDAPTLPDRWRDARINGRSEGRRSALIASWLAATTLADLHRLGWRHCDLQGAHVLVPDLGRALLIDFALTQGPAQIDPQVTYRGALAHLTAPEIAREILDSPSDHHVNLTHEAEVYMFGAVLFAAWTGQWPIDYSTSNPRELTLEQIHTAICDPRTRRPLPDTWPSMADLISSLLEHGPDDRPTMAEVRDALTDQLGGRA